MQLNRIELPSLADVAEIMASETLPELASERVHMQENHQGILANEDGFRSFISEGISPLRGMLQGVLLREDGSVLYHAEENLVVNSGWDLLCDVIGKNNQPSDLTHIGIGTGTTAVDASQTDLVAQVARESATYAHTAGTKIFTMQASFPAGTGTGAITEAGLFNAATGATLFSRVVFAAINKGATDIYQETFTYTFS